MARDQKAIQKKIEQSRVRRVQISVKKAEIALKDSAGIVDVAAKRLGCSRAYLYNFIKENPHLNELRQQERERFIDMAESKLVKKVQEESDWAIKYTLQTLGRKRGYEINESNNINIIQGEKQLVVVSDGTVQGNIKRKTAGSVEASDEQSDE